MEDTVLLRSRLSRNAGRLPLGPIVGSTTAGAVMAGKPICLDNGDILYCAVRDVLVDGKRLEGMGVQPTVPVERPLEFASGRDPQLEAAIEAVGKLHATRALPRRLRTTAGGGSKPPARGGLY